MNDAIRSLVRAKVRFLVIGGHAIRYAGFARMTSDWDLFIPPHDLKNFARINAALKNEQDILVAPLGPNGENFIQTFQTQWSVIQFHLIMAGVPSFEDAEAAAVEVNDDGLTFKRLSGLHLLANKQKADRAEDQADIRFLKELQARGLLV
jgi:hypothetical protein